MISILSIVTVVLTTISILNLLSQIKSMEKIANMQRQITTDLKDQQKNLREQIEILEARSRFEKLKS